MTFRAISVTAWVLLVVTIAAGTAAQEGPPSPDAKGQIESRIASVQAGVAARDVDRVVAALDDSVVITAEGRTLRGRANARQILTVLSTRLVDVSFEMSTAMLRVADSAAFHTGDFSYTLNFPMGGSFTREGRFVADWRKVDDNDWRIVQLIAVPRPPADSAR